MRHTPAMKPGTRGVIVRLFALVAVMGLAATLVFGYLGWLHMAFDSFSHFRVHASVALLLCAPVLYILRFRPEALFAIALGAITLVHTIGLPAAGLDRSTSASASGDAYIGDNAVYRLLHLNLYFANREPEVALSLIGRVKPDIVTLNEVSAMWAEKLALLEAAYPYTLICSQPTQIGGVAILSRRPFSPHSAPRCGDRGAFGHVTLDLGGLSVDVAALHLGWPWPFTQPWQLPQIEPLLSGVGDTAIIAGDLNAAPWSFAARRVAGASNARLLRGIGPTWLHFQLPDALRPVIGLPIDNALVKGGVVPIRLGTEEGGSDHLAVVVDFAVLPQEAAPQVLQAATEDQGSRSAQ